MEPSLWDHFEKYLRHLDGRECTPATHHHKRKEIALFLRFLAGTGHSLMVADVTTEHIEAHFEDMQDRGLSIMSIKTRRRTLHAWWAWMVQRKIAGTNIVSEVPDPKAPVIRKPSLSEADFQRVLEACDDSTLTGRRRQAMLVLSATTGLRRGELADLRRDDLDWEQGQVLIRKGKGQKSRRVPFMPGVQEVMSRYLALREDADPALWITEKGLPLQYHGIGQDMSRLYQRVGLKVVDCLHIYRRSFATSASLQRMPRWYTNKIAGWRDDQMQSYYTADMEDEDAAITYFTRNFTPLGEEAGTATEPLIRPADAIEVEKSAAPKFLKLRDMTYYCHQRVFVVIGESRIELTVDALQLGGR